MRKKVINSFTGGDKSMDERSVVKQKSLVNILAGGIIVPVVLLVLLLLVYNAYSMSYYNRQLMDATKTSLSLYIKNITDSQEATDALMNDLISSNSNYWSLQRELTSIEVYSRQYELMKIIKYYMGSNQCINDLQCSQ